jgi:hypothetical protein
MSPYRRTTCRAAIVLAATILAPSLALAQVAPQSPASPSGNSVRGAAQTAPPTSYSAPIQNNQTRPEQNQINQGQSPGLTDRNNPASPTRPNGGAAQQTR